jgi:iron complex outermembrane receptor protein
LIPSLCIISTASLLIVPTVQASGVAQPSAETIKLRDFNRPATTLKEWEQKLNSSKLITQNAPVPIISVQLNRVDDGLDIVLTAENGNPLPVDATNFRAEGNSLIADIPNAVLALPEGNKFQADNPTSDIANVTVAQVDATSIQVRVVGKEALPTSEVTLRRVH